MDRRDERRGAGAARDGRSALDGRRSSVLRDSAPKAGRPVGDDEIDRVRRRAVETLEARGTVCGEGLVQVVGGHDLEPVVAVQESHGGTERVTVVRGRSPGSSRTGGPSPVPAEQERATHPGEREVFAQAPWPGSASLATTSAQRIVRAQEAIDDLQAGQQSAAAVRDVERERAVGIGWGSSGLAPDVLLDERRERGLAEVPIPVEPDVDEQVEVVRRAPASSRQHFAVATARRRALCRDRHATRVDRQLGQ